MKPNKIGCRLGRADVKPNKIGCRLGRANAKPNKIGCRLGRADAKPNKIGCRLGRANVKPNAQSKYKIKVMCMRYRRSKIKGATYFFTVVTHNRRRFLCIPDNVELLRQAFRRTIQRYPIQIDAFVLLPDHLHCIWTLPEGDHNYSMRWRQIKSHFSRYCQTTDDGIITESRQSKQERGFWQRRFWEHTIRNDQDFIRHVEYIHYNPVKHGLVTAPKDWEYSSFHYYVKAGLYDKMWGSGDEISFCMEIGNE